MNAIIVLFILGTIIYFFLKDRHKMLEQQVDNYGGMKNKYAVLINWILSDSNAKIVKITRDHIQISNILTSTQTHFLITENFDCVQIEWKANLGVMGIHNKKWKFNSAVSNYQIIDKIAIDLNDYSSIYIN